MKNKLSGYTSFLYVLGTINVVLILYSFVFLLVCSFPEFDGVLHLWNCFGIAVSVVFLKWMAEKWGKVWWGRIAVTLLALLSVLSTFGSVVKVAWTFAYLVFFIPAFFAPRPDGRVLMAKPRIWHVLPFLVDYAIGVAFDNINLRIAGFLLIYIFLIITVLDANITGCMRRIRNASGEVEVDGIVKENRRTLTVFVIVFIVLSLLIPIAFNYLSRSTEGSPVVYEFQGNVGEEEDEVKLPLPPLGGAVSRETKAFDLAWLGTFLLWLFVASLALALIFVLAVLVMRVMDIDGRKRRHRDEFGSSFTVESVTEEKRDEKRERLSLFSLEHRIRRRYISLVKAMKGKESVFSMTPGEVEEALFPHSLSSGKVTDIYQRVRYSESVVTRKDEEEMKKECAAVRRDKKSSK